MISEQSGDGTKADGDPSLRFSATVTRHARGNGPPQDITPNHRALALRFGLFDRFFVNSEASPDGHNWSTAAFSTDYVDKSFRWSYSGRGRPTTTKDSIARPDSMPRSFLRDCACQRPPRRSPPS